MAIREIRIDGDPLLRKRSREVEKIDDRILELFDDMVETMKSANGIGLAAPQIGILKRLVVIDIEDENGLMKMVNPEILEINGSQIEVEGCLSIPNFMGTVERPEYVKFKYTNEKGEEIIKQAHKLLARAICHEIDHLDGVLFKDKYIEEYKYNEEEEMLEI